MKATQIFKKAIEAIAKRPISFLDAPTALQNNISFVLEAVYTDARVLQYVKPEFLVNEYVIMTAADGLNG